MLLVLGLITLLTCAGAIPARAHDQLLGSDPADGAILDTPPGAITLTFSAEILPVAPTVRVQDAAGAVVVDADPFVAGAVVTQPMPTVPPGAYTVTWRVVSTDGHPIEGTFAFTVASAADASPSATIATSPEVTASSADLTSSAPAPESTTTAPAETSGAQGIPTPVRLLFALAAVGAVATAAILVARRRAS